RGNNVDWLNIQFYEGGAIENGHSEDIATYYKESLAAPLLQLRATTGIAQPLHFLQPAFMPDAKPPQSLDFCERTLRAINGICASLHAGALDGVTLWEYKQVLPEIASWSRSLEETLIGRAG
ncbi:MAG TPA: hypothetical protein VMU62_05125, partial [Acidobacteriaceae bacterium]|nr:hypothetical protein [Acidobacteriaceae bacterium]